MKKSVKLIVSGSIQPMFFNRFIKENADQLGVKGFVRKLEDNRVEIFVEGDIDAVNQMMPLCKRGPKHSMIKKVEETPGHFQDYKDFRVLSF